MTVWYKRDWKNSFQAADIITNVDAQILSGNEERYWLISVFLLHRCYWSCRPAGTLRQLQDCRQPYPCGLDGVRQSVPRPVRHPRHHGVWGGRRALPSICVWQQNLLGLQKQLCHEYHVSEWYHSTTNNLDNSLCAHEITVIIAAVTLITLWFCVSFYPDKRFRILRDESLSRKLTAEDTQVEY